MAESDGAMVRLKMLQTVYALVGGANQRLVAGEVYEAPLDTAVMDLVRGRYATLVEEEPPAPGPGPETASVQPGDEVAVLPRARRKRGA